MNKRFFRSARFEAELAKPRRGQPSVQQEGDIL
jgi:hypothetical protein